MGYFLGYGRVGTTVRIHHLESNETYKENSAWELEKNSASCFEQILKAAHQQTTSSYLLSHKTYN